MSASVCLIIIAIFILCVVVFTKTVSNDAKNDFKIRDILSNSEPFEEPIEEETISNKLNLKQKPIQETYKEIHHETSQQPQEEFVTTIHEEKYYNSEDKSYSGLKQEESYYEKSRYVETDKFDDNNKNIKPNSNCQKPDYIEQEYIETEDINDKAIAGLRFKKDTSMLSPVKNALWYVKTFWRGITFTLGLLTALYSLYGIAFYVQTSNDAVIYSIWLLIGVILIK